MAGSSKVLDNVRDEHDDGLWPDYEVSTQSVRDTPALERTEATRDTEIKESSSKKSSDKKD